MDLRELQVLRGTWERPVLLAPRVQLVLLGLRVRPEQVLQVQLGQPV